MLLHMLLMMASYSHAYEQAIETPTCTPRPEPSVRACEPSEGCEEVWTFGNEEPLS